MPHDNVDGDRHRSQPFAESVVVGAWGRRFVDCYVDGDIGVCRSIGKLDCVVDPSNRAHRIPNTDKVYIAFARKSCFKIGKYMKIDIVAFDHPNSIWNQRFIARRE